MKCPIDSADLLMTDRQGVEIDYCPTCRGVWLDRGEIDKLIERSAVAPAVSPQPHKPEYRSGDDHHYSRKHKKENFLGEMFDF